MQVDPEQAMVTELRREVQLLRTENAYLRNLVVLYLDQC